MLSCLNRKITQNKTKHLLVENELNKLKTFDSSYFIGKCHFDEYGVQNYVVFQPLNIYFKLMANTLYSEIVAPQLCLGIISKDWSTDNMKKIGFNGYVFFDMILV